MDSSANPAGGAKSVQNKGFSGRPGSAILGPRREILLKSVLLLLLAGYVYSSLFSGGG